MTELNKIKMGVNPDRPCPNIILNGFNLSINDIAQNATIVYLQREENREPTQHTASGRPGQTLYCLVAAGERGITAAEVSNWALRLAGYVYDLRHKHGLNIQAAQEPNTTGIGTHARYILQSDVQIIEIRQSKGAKDA